MKMLKVTAKADNRKLGKGVATTIRPVGPTCPQDCSLLNNGCYAVRGPAGIWQNRSKDINDSLDKAKGVSLIRHHVSGDLYRNDKLDVRYLKTVLNWHKNNPNVEGWMYTHRIQDLDAVGITSDTIPANLTVIASVDTDIDIAYAIANGWKYARVTHKDREKLDTTKEIWCPFDKAKHKGRKIEDIKVTCKSCRLCFDDKFSHLNIVFQYSKAGRKKKAVAPTPITIKGNALS